MAADDFKINPDEIRSNPIFHGVSWEFSHPEGGPLKPSEFLQAPLLHVGTREQALQSAIGGDVDNYMSGDMDETPRRVWNPNMKYPGIHKLSFSQFAEFHPTVVSDEVANAVNAQKLRDIGLEPNSRTETSSRMKKGMEKEYADALQAVNENKILAYRNTFETPRDRSGGVRTDTHPMETISFLVPSPILNLKKAGKSKDPLVQPTLPMDFVGSVSESATTREKKEQMKDAKKR